MLFFYYLEEILLYTCIKNTHELYAHVYNLSNLICLRYHLSSVAKRYPRSDTLKKQNQRVDGALTAAHRTELGNSIS